MPRLCREAPLNGIWEGSGNVMALDVRRAMARRSERIDAFAAEVDPAAADWHLDVAWRALRHEFGGAEWTSRRPDG